MVEELKAVLVGCGQMSGAWLQAAAATPGLRIAGLVDLNEEAAQRKRDEFHLTGVPTDTDLRAMLKSVAPDMVFDCTIPKAHMEIVLESLRCGCHVLGEKPMSDSMANARRMVNAAARADRLYAVIQNRRYDPRIRALRRFLASGKIGTITTINSDFYIGAHFGGFRDHMEHVLLVDMAIHTFDAARYLAAADPVAVYCHEWNPVGSWYDHDASAVAVFEMSDGMVYTYRGSWCSEGSHTSWESEWRIVGTQGTAVWDGGDRLAAQAVVLTGGFHSILRDVPVPPPAWDEESGHLALIREFVDCVRTGKTPETVCHDNIRSLAMVFAAVESAEKHKRVAVPQFTGRGKVAAS